MADLETVYPLKDAVVRFFPCGNWTVSSLRTEIRKGRLRPERIAGKLGVTESAIREMRALCREEAKAPASISENAPVAEPFGSFSTEERKSALTAARATLKGLKAPSQPTLPKNTNRRKPMANSPRP